MLNICGSMLLDFKEALQIVWNNDEGLLCIFSKCIFSVFHAIK